MKKIVILFFILINIISCNNNTKKNRDLESILNEDSTKIEINSEDDVTINEFIFNNEEDPAPENISNESEINSDDDKVNPKDPISNNNQTTNVTIDNNIDISNYIDGNVSFEEVLFSTEIPDFIKNMFLEEAFIFFSKAKVDDAFGKNALETFQLIQPSRLSISSSIKTMYETYNLSQYEIENNIYKNTTFPDLLITPDLINNYLPVEVGKILYVFNVILNNKIVGSAFKKYYYDSAYYKSSSVNTIKEEDIDMMDLDDGLLKNLIESIIINIEFFDTYSNYDFYDILNHPAMEDYVIDALKKILRRNPLSINPGIFLKLNIEKKIIKNTALIKVIKDQIENGELYKTVIGEHKLSSKYIKSLTLIAVLYNYLFHNSINLSNLDKIKFNIVNNLVTPSETLNEIIELSYEILNSNFPKSYMTTDKLIRTYHRYHLSAGISGLTYGSVSWDYSHSEGLSMYLISGDYKIYEMSMETRNLLVLDNIYKQAAEADIFLPIHDFEFSNDHNIALINVAKSTYTNSFIFDFKKYEFLELTEMFNKKVFTCIGYMGPYKRRIFAQSLNAENERDDLMMISPAKGYRKQSLIADSKVDTLEISPSGTRLLITGNLNPEERINHTKVYIYDIFSKRVKEIPVEANWSSFSWDLEEELIYFTVDNKDLYVFNVSDFKSKMVLKTDLYIYSLAAGREMFAFSYLNQDTEENRLYLYKTDDQQNILIESIDNGVIRSGFSPDGNYLFYEVLKDEHKDLFLLEIN